MAVVPKEKVATLEQKKFLESIREIHHDPMIPNAMLDYWKAHITIAKYFRDNLMYLKSLEPYVSELSEKMSYAKSDSEINAESFDNPTPAESVRYRPFGDFPALF